MKRFLNSFSSFAYLNVTQFLGAMNDNIFKLLIIYFFIQLEGIENSPIILASTGAVFVLPFLLFSSSAGLLADRYSKSRIIIGTKILELVIMLLGLIAFLYASKWGSYCILFLLALQATLFSPSKYGIIPEMVPPEKISKSNGAMTSCTYLAIIFGTFLASFILDITGRSFKVAAIFCIIVSIFGVISSLFIQYTKPSGSRKELNVHFISAIYQTLKTVRKEPSLLAAILGSAFFLFLASYVQLNVIPFAVQSLNLTDVQGGYLFLLTAIGIGTGSIIAGKLSGTTVELGLSPIAALGITVCFFLLNAYSTHLFVCIPLVITIGLFGGIYLIPLDSYVQIASPKQIIGQAVAASTFLSFFGVFCASGLLYLVSQVFGFTAAQGFEILGYLTFIVSITYTYLFFDYVTRFAGMILSRAHFSIHFVGQENIPTSPALYICTHTAWNDTLLLLGAQRRRMRFFIEREQPHSPWFKKLYNLFKVVLIPEVESLENDPRCLAAIRKTLNRGVSVCIFINERDVENEFEKLKNADLVKAILREKYPVVLVRIEKGIKTTQSRFFTDFLNKFRVPAQISFEATSWSHIEKEDSPKAIMAEPSSLSRNSDLLDPITESI